jgi:hypothetical protein
LVLTRPRCSRISKEFNRENPLNRPKTRDEVHIRYT